MTTDFYQPAYCSPLHDHWPLPQVLAGGRLLSCEFDPQLFDPADFQRCLISPAPGAAKRQSEFLAGRLCARQALLQLTGRPAVPAIGADRAPCWPTAVVGSITHGDGWAAAVVAEQRHWRGLGLDIERLLSPQRAQRLQASILTAAEQERLGDYPSAQHAWLISLTFSLKESLFKALYPLVRQPFYLHDAELLSTTPNGTAQLQLLRDLSREWPAGSHCQGQFVQLQQRLLSLVSIPA